MNSSTQPARPGLLADAALDAGVDGAACGVVPDALDGVDADALRRARWPEGLVAMLRVQEAAFRRSGLDAQAAFRLAKAGVLALAQYHGGRQWYLPRGDDLHLALRDAEIYRRADRDTLDALAREYGLTVTSVYRIIKAQMALHVAQRQGQLFAPGTTHTIDARRHAAAKTTSHPPPLTI